MPCRWQKCTDIAEGAAANLSKTAGASRLHRTIHTLLPITRCHAINTVIFRWQNLPNPCRSSHQNRNCLSFRIIISTYFTQSTRVFYYYFVCKVIGCILSTRCAFSGCVDLRTNSDYFPIQHELVGFCNRDGMCLLRGTSWVFIYTADQSLRDFPLHSFPAFALIAAYVYQKDVRARFNQWSSVITPVVVIVVVVAVAVVNIITCSAFHCTSPSQLFP